METLLKSFFIFCAEVVEYFRILACAQQQVWISEHSGVGGGVGGTRTKVVGGFQLDYPRLVEKL